MATRAILAVRWDQGYSYACQCSNYVKNSENSMQLQEQNIPAHTLQCCNGSHLEEKSNHLLHKLTICIICIKLMKFALDLWNEVYKWLLSSAHAHVSWESQFFSVFKSCNDLKKGVMQKKLWCGGKAKNDRKKTPAFYLWKHDHQ